nr:MAG TPA: hypothetical protein [Caudoviricetes sp.]
MIASPPYRYFSRTTLQYAGWYRVIELNLYPNS